MKSIGRFFANHWKKIIITVVALLLIAVIGAALFVNNLLSKVNYDEPYKKTSSSGDILNGSLPQNTVQKDDFTDEKIHTVDGDSTKTAIKNWCESGTLASSDDVINILLIGMDNKNIHVNSRADSMMIASVNKQTGKITLASILRDQYAYVNSKSIKFEKMHHAMVRGGPQKQISVIEAHYKVRIDNYILVNFTSFEKIIDRLGGVSITLSKAEANHLGMSAGTQVLSGKDALRYARIRKIDSDVARTNRQQTVISAIIMKARTASIGELTQVINDLLPNVRTGMSRSEIMDMVMDAFTGGWLKYDIVKYTAPQEEYRRGGFIGSLWYWTVNYPHAAEGLQKALYGRSNIVFDSEETSSQQ